MKNLGIAIVLGLTVTLMSCRNEKKQVQKVDNEPTNQPVQPTQTKAGEVNWDDAPDVKDIGNFPFVTAPTGLTIYREKNGVTELFDFDEMQNYVGGGVYTSEGKLGILAFEGVGEEDFNQKIFDKAIYNYLDKTMGAKQLYKGDFPENEADKTKLEKNMWSGKHMTAGLIRESGAPFAVYVFKNNGKKYILNVQSNSAQGNIFIMELKDFEQTIKKYSAAEMKNEIDKTNKAILNINFDTDKASIKPDGLIIVAEIVSLLKTNTTLNLSIEGHTDNTGTPQRNKQLSQERAKAVMSSLIEKGIDSKRLKSVGFGSEKPINPNDTEENKAKNRRVELVKF